MADFRCGTVARACVLGCLCIVVASASGSAEARPLRGPVMRAERRVARAEAALERELGRPPERPRTAALAAEARRAQTATRNPASPAPPRAPQARSAAPAPTPAPQSRDEVARAAFESPAQPGRRADEPAEDGTYSVLVRPDAASEKADGPRQGEPLRFPDAQSP